MSKLNTASTPLMDQYRQIKSQYQDTILLYRMGDFYETFYEDAQLISKLLGIALTKRSHGKSAQVPLAGFPYHALENYMYKLVKAGQRVAICEQVEDPKLAKGVVKRNVIEIVTPGTTLSEKLLDHKSNNYLAALFIGVEKAALACSDVSTGEFYVSEVELSNLLDHLIPFAPREILVSKSQKEKIAALLDRRISAVLTPRDDWVFEYNYAGEQIRKKYQTHSLKGFGLDLLREGVIVAGAILNYLQENNKSGLDHIRHPRILNLTDFMLLDEATRRNLEIYNPIREDIGGNTLLAVLDKTRTAMGGRLLKRWFTQPLRQVDKINTRLQLIAAMIEHKPVLQSIQKHLSDLADLERLISKISIGRCNARDLIYLKNSLQIIPQIVTQIRQCAAAVLQTQFAGLQELPQSIDLISGAIVDDPPVTITDGDMIRTGYSPELDELHAITHSGKNWLLSLQEEERKRTGINNLKINFNRVFGYYIEITRSNLPKIPSDYIRKQTLVNAERFITPALKEKEEKILGAEEKIKQLEYDLFQQVRTELIKQTVPIQENSSQLAFLDCICSLAQAAIENHYTRPVINDDQILQIKNGRHPVVEKFLRPGEEFVPNYVYLNPEDEQIWIITGPNMAGKSTFLRQVGLTVFMAQVGSYVPADEAKIGVVDRIFTRVGASDNLASGESTFLVEMNETANILSNASSRSLILLDEIGRGTSTFDGLSIAWAVAEYLHNEKTLRARTLFATHYHELTELARLYPRIKNYNIAVEEWGKQILFLRKIVPGGTDNSYGIHVAQMAGLPGTVIERSREILANLEANELSVNSLPKLAIHQPGRDVDHDQLSLFQTQNFSIVEDKIKALDIDNMTPVQALLKLSELKDLAGAEKKADLAKTEENKIRDK
jgi:DNA mismatch repair protein MutS